MAGGRGERMRAAGRPVPKPLVAIRGVPLLERNLVTLLFAGFRDLIVAVPSHTPRIGEFVATRGRALAGVLGAEIRLLEETRPLGNIGAAAEVGSCDPELLVVYADNLSALALDAMLEHHRRTRAALTTAVHLEAFRMPFGAVEIRDGMLIGYQEKPELRIQVSSGYYVLGPAAIAALPHGERIEVSALVNQLLRTGERVAAYSHDAPWIDVNDDDAVSRAEALVATHSAAFECGSPAPRSVVVSTLARRAGRVLLERRSSKADRYPGTLDLPGSVHGAGELIRDPPDCMFDDIDPASRQIYRHLVFAREATEAVSDSAFWHEPLDADALSPVVRRTLACLGAG
jgi:NDP-mannose synthase